MYVCVCVSQCSLPKENECFCSIRLYNVVQASGLGGLCIGIPSGAMPPKRFHRKIRQFHCLDAITQRLGQYYQWPCCDVLYIIAFFEKVKNV